VLVGIFGAGRNGSSLLMRLLDGSPGLWIYPIELNYLRSFAPRSLKSAVKRTLASCVSHLPGQAGERSNNDSGSCFEPGQPISWMSSSRPIWISW
jgi:hypothetical protein